MAQAILPIGGRLMISTCNKPAKIIGSILFSLFLVLPMQANEKFIDGYVDYLNVLAQLKQTISSGNLGTDEDSFLDTFKRMDKIKQIWSQTVNPRSEIKRWGNDVIRMRDDGIKNLKKEVDDETAHSKQRVVTITRSTDQSHSCFFSMLDWLVSWSKRLQGIGYTWIFKKRD